MEKKHPNRGVIVASLAVIAWGVTGAGVYTAYLLLKWWGV